MDRMQLSYSVKSKRRQNIVLFVCLFFILSIMYCEWPHLGRCCFCLPLRKGVLILGYVNVIFNAFTIGFHSYIIHSYSEGRQVRLQATLSFPTEVLIAMNCVEIIFCVVLIYGAHMQSLKCIKVFYYFALLWTLGMTAMQLLEPIAGGNVSFILEMLVFTFAFVCIQLYLITLVRSLLRKMESDGPHVYANQLHQIVNGDPVTDANGVYNNTTTPAVV